MSPTKRSTTTSLLDCQQYWKCAVYNKVSVDVIYIGMAKVFDTMSHDKFLFKTSFLVFCGYVLVLIKTFHRKRTQRVRVGSTMSGPATVVTGIPQGRILGALSFCCTSMIYLSELHFLNYYYMLMFRSCTLSLVP